MERNRSRALKMLRTSQYQASLFDELMFGKCIHAFASVHQVGGGGKFRTLSFSNAYVWLRRSSGIGAS